MTEKCFDIGTIQAFLDGELTSERMEAVSRHIALCDDCAISLAEAEEESAFAFSALEQEFNTLVPTQRLWTKINDSIERENKSFWKPIFAFFSNPTIAAFASLLIVFGLFTALLSFRSETPNDFASKTEQRRENSIPASTTAQPNIQNPTENIQTPSSIERPALVLATSSSNNKPESRFVKTDLIKQREAKSNVNNQRNAPQTSTPNLSVENVQLASNENVAGEDSYVKTIATLQETVNSRKDEVLKPSARFAFERDLAVTDNAIKTMRAEVKQNPKNEAAKQILKASYQNKIDLLNSVAEKNELMASLK
jgi:hypothetical protein